MWYLIVSIPDLCNITYIFYRRWYEKIKYLIKDLLNEDGTMMSLNQFSDRYNLQIDFMQYFSVRTAVKTILKSNKGCRDMYKIINEKEIITKSQIKWNGIFETENL